VGLKLGALKQRSIDLLAFLIQHGVHAAAKLGTALRSASRILYRFMHRPTSWPTKP